MNDRMFAQLKPEGLDELTEETYRRRRAADLAATFATPPAATPPATTRPAAARRRRPLILVGALAAGVAAAVVIVPGPGDSGTPPQAITSTVSPTASSTRPPESRTLDAHTVLLAAAESATRTPAGSGRYWYVRDRTFQRVHNVESEYHASVQSLVDELERRRKALKDKPDELRAAEREFERRLVKLKTATLPYAAFVADSTESWRPRLPGMKNRTQRGRDQEVSFGSPADEAKWRQAGSPDLRPRPSSNEDDTERILSIANPSLNMRNVDELPTDSKALERKLRQLYQAQQGEKGTFPVYLWQTSVDLLGAPITPGTREALFRVLAGQKGITSQGEVADAKGRTGAALMTEETTADGERYEYRLIIDPDSAGLLQYEVAEVGDPAPLLRVALEETAWVDRLGERP
ncbi:CU044_5270 family protein [Nonomuraea sp. ZG12]|uniref:CU044_5270 family protein n=1 Tax=Nonomuraea sp. ZG12 TaxID=3452207 RepID=UPI003F8B8E9B